jgi:hypothetical protein
MPKFIEDPLLFGSIRLLGRRRKSGRDDKSGKDRTENWFQQCNLAGFVVSQST